MEAEVGRQVQAANQDSQLQAQVSKTTAKKGRTAVEVVQAANKDSQLQAQVPQTTAKEGPTDSGLQAQVPETTAKEGPRAPGTGSGDNGKGRGPRFSSSSSHGSTLQEEASSLM